MSARHVLVAAVVVVVAAAVAAGIVLIGPPGEERTRRLDERRVQDLRQISWSTYLYHTRHQRLPASLAALSEEPGLTFESRDSVTDETYGYSVLEPARYQLCAVFDRESTEGRSDFWSHGEGRQCYTLKADEKR